MAVKIGNKSVPEATELMDQWYGSENPEQWKMLVDEERLKLEVGQIIYDLRKEAGLSQTALAKRIGTGQAIISKAEHGDYDGSCLEILRRVCAALKHPVRVSRNIETREIRVAC